MSWYRCEASLRNSPKVVRLARRLGIPTAHARGLLTGLWAWACEARPSGDLTGLDAVDLAFAAEWDGEPGELEAALIECRLIDVEDDQRSIHDWSPDPSYRRAQVDARRREADRERKRAVRRVSAECPQTSAPCPQTSADMESASADVRTRPQTSADKVRTSADTHRGEERRGEEKRGKEEEEEEESLLTSPPPDRASTPRVRSADRDTSPPVLVYPCTGPVASWTLTQAQVDRWRELYPGVDVDRETRKALAYVEAGRRKTASGMARFLAGWRGRANARGGRGPPPAAAPARDYRREGELAREERLRAVYEERGILPREDAPGLRAIQGGGDP